MAALFDNGIFSVVGNDAGLGIGWKLAFYQSGTTTKRDTYPTQADAVAGTNPNPNPVISDANGRFGQIWVVDSQYKCILSDENDIPQFTRDPCIPAADNTLRADLLSSTGATKVSYARSAPQALTRSLQDLFDEDVRLTDFVGCDPTGATSSVAALERAAAVSNSVILPPGTYLFDRVATIPNGSFRLTGSGKGKTFVIFNHPALSGALNITAASVNDYVEITGFTAVAGCVDNRTWIGLWVTFPSSSSYPYRQVDIDVDWRSDLASTSPSWPRTWGRAVRLTNVWYPRLRGCGSAAPVAGEPGNVGFLEVTGGSYGMIGADIDVIWYYGADFIRGSAYMETIFLGNSEAVGVTRGIYVPSTTPVGGAAGLYRAASIWAANSHIASHTVGMDLDLVADVRSNGFDMQRWGVPSATNWVGYKINNCPYPKFIGGTIGGADASGAVTTTGIQVTGTQSAHGVILGMTFLSCDTQFTLDSSTSHWTIRSNVGAGNPDAWTALGTNHDIEWFNASGQVQRLVNSVCTSGLALSQAGEIGKSSATGITYTAAEFLNDAIFRSGASGAVSDTTPTAAQIIAAMGAPPVGVGKRITINNQSLGTLTLVAGTGVSLVSTTTVGAGQSRDYLIRVTSVTPGAEAVRLVGLQTGPI